MPGLRSRTSTSYVPWAELMRTTLGINMLDCPKCHTSMRAIAAHHQARGDPQDIVAPAPGAVPRYRGDDACVSYYDVTDQPAADWVKGVDPEACERDPPTDYDAVDPPSHDEYPWASRDRIRLRAAAGRGHAHVRPRRSLKGGSEGTADASSG